MQSMLATWLLAAATSLSPNRNHEALTQAIEKVLTDQAPLFAKDENRQRSAALLLAINFREGSLIPNIKGDKDKRGNFTSFCSMQIHLPYGAKTEEGWTGEELVEDPVKCITVGVRMLRISMKVCPKHPVAFYAEGVDQRTCDSVRAQRISNDRMFLAQRLVKGVQWPEEQHASAQPPLRSVPPRLYASRLPGESDR